MKAKATIRLKFPSEKHLEIVLKALEPEIRKSPTTRSQATFTRKKNLIILSVAAKDTVALRAAVNAYLRWINSTTNVLEILEGIS
ncbi:MAG: KEOPS complex subunit Pcc1 [Candidatus Bathyarchaeia archaeon]